MLTTIEDNLGLCATATDRKDRNFKKNLCLLFFFKNYKLK